MTPEHNLMNQIRLWAGQNDIICFRVNVGRVYTASGEFFSTGLPVGFPDLIAFDAAGHTFFIECKVAPNKPSPQQLAFINSMTARGFCAFVAYSLADAVKYLSKPYTAN